MLEEGGVLMENLVLSEDIGKKSARSHLFLTFALDPLARSPKPLKKQPASFLNTPRSFEALPSLTQKRCPER